MTNIFESKYPVMTPDLQVILVSPGAHYPAHNWSNTVALLHALRRKKQNVRAIIFSTGTEPVPPDLQDCVTPVFARTPGPWKRVVAGKWQERRLAGLMNSFETFTCLFQAWCLARRHPNTSLHFIGGSSWLVVL